LRLAARRERTVKHELDARRAIGAASSSPWRNDPTMYGKSPASSWILIAVFVAACGEPVPPIAPVYDIHVQ
jgi:hypothetical protein